MGQAKARGTFEEREANAHLRNRLVAKLIADSGNKHLKALVSVHGIQRVASRIAATRELQSLKDAADKASAPHIVQPGSLFVPKDYK